VHGRANFVRDVGLEARVLEVNQLVVARGVHDGDGEVADVDVVLPDSFAQLLVDLVFGHVCGDALGEDVIVVPQGEDFAGHGKVVGIIVVVGLKDTEVNRKELGVRKKSFRTKEVNEQTLAARPMISRHLHRCISTILITGAV
jgi:hypothetical protein